MNLDELSPVNRPFALSEIARVFRVDSTKLRRLLDHVGIRPACRVSRLGLYGPKQIREIHSLLRHMGALDEVSTPEPEPEPEARKTRTSPRSAGGRKVGPRSPR